MRRDDNDKHLPKAPPGARCIVCGADTVGNRCKASRIGYAGDERTFYFCSRDASEACFKSLIIDAGNVADADGKPLCLVNIPGKPAGAWQWLELEVVRNTPVCPPPPEQLSLEEAV